MYYIFARNEIVNLKAKMSIFFSNDEKTVSHLHIREKKVCKTMQPVLYIFWNYRKGNNFLYTNNIVSVLAGVVEKQEKSCLI